MPVVKYLVPLSRNLSPSLVSLVFQVKAPAGVEPSSVDALPTILPLQRQLRHPSALVTAEPEPLLDVGEVPAQDVRDVDIGGRPVR